MSIPDVTWNFDRIRYGTEAHHPLGDISRPNGGFFSFDDEDDENYYGHWLTGMGFIGVRFPKATSRELTADEREWMSRHRITIGPFR